MFHQIFIRLVIFSLAFNSVVLKKFSISATDLSDIYGDKVCILEKSILMVTLRDIYGDANDSTP